jgi:hypothetical protein
VLLHASVLAFAAEIEALAAADQEIDIIDMCRYQTLVAQGDQA